MSPHVWMPMESTRRCWILWSWGVIGSCDLWDVGAVIPACIFARVASMLNH